MRGTFFTGAATRLCGLSLVCAATDAPLLTCRQVDHVIDVTAAASYVTMCIASKPLTGAIKAVKASLCDPQRAHSLIARVIQTLLTAQYFDSPEAKQYRAMIQPG